MHLHYTIIFFYDTNRACTTGGSRAYLLLDPAAPASISSIPKKFPEEKIVNVAEVNQRRCLEESGQWFENVNQTHLVLAS